MSKEKNTFDPFARHLRPTEKIVWMSVQAEDSLWDHFKTVARIVVGASVATFVFALVIQINPFLITAIVAILIALASLPFFLSRGTQRVVNGPQLPEHVYALTNERLLYCHHTDVTSIPLESVPSVSMFAGEGTKGTLNFGALFPMWPDVKDAAEVKRLIDEAQKKRIKEVKA